MMQRRAFLSGLIGLAAPAVIRTPGLLMPVHRVLTPELDYVRITIALGYVVSAEQIRDALLPGLHSGLEAAHWRWVPKGEKKK